LLVLLALSLSSAIYVPTQYVSPEPFDGAQPFSSITYAMPTCKSTDLDGRGLLFDVNIQNIPWNQSAAAIVNVQVYNENGVMIGNNTVGGQFQANFSITYQTSMGDLSITCTTGNRANIDFTFSATFSNSLEKDVKPWSPEGLPKIELPQAVVYLQEIINTGVKYSVTTLDTVLIDFAYCPPPDSNQYTVIITALAADPTSAVSLYICTDPSQMPCTQGSAPRQNTDARGIALVTVSLGTTTAQFQQMQALIEGMGVYGETNTFVLAVNVKVGTS